MYRTSEDAHLAESGLVSLWQNNYYGSEVSHKDILMSSGKTPQPAQSENFVDSVQFLSSPVRVATDSVVKVVRFRHLNRMGPRTKGLLHVQSSFDRWFRLQKVFCMHYSNAWIGCRTRLLR